MEGRLDMFLARGLTAVLLVIALSLSACAAFDFYPSPRPNDLMVGQDEGLITRDWDGGEPVRVPSPVVKPLSLPPKRERTTPESHHQLFSYAVFFFEKKK